MSRARAAGSCPPFVFPWQCQAAAVAANNRHVLVQQAVPATGRCGVEPQLLLRLPCPPAPPLWSRCRADNSQEVVATVVPGSEGGELSGLDLHALAFTDLPEHATSGPAEQAAGDDPENATPGAGQ